jgi:hypothetical protein
LPFLHQQNLQSEETLPQSHQKIQDKNCTQMTSGTLIEKRRRTALPRAQAWNAHVRSPWPVMAIDRGRRAASDGGRKNRGWGGGGVVGVCNKSVSG